MATYPAVNVAAVDCQKQVHSWPLCRSLIEFLIPTCNCAFAEEEPTYSSKPLFPSPATAANSVTGKIFCYRRRKVNFCIQTAILARLAYRMYFNGMEVGYTLRWQASATDVGTLRRMGTVVEGGGIIGGDGEELFVPLCSNPFELVVFWAAFGVTVALSMSPPPSICRLDEHYINYMSVCDVDGNLLGCQKKPRGKI
ncbi:uncharacterized protein LOC111463089 [Cucurbita moschata]|uniref:Uncharacterized protein LOC111463089 n=1 Tax=Cucurbita moschata TaxID=3662 RepID=A0A6J1HD86_CUCMO|nr:uncharacterized protein LOC111463089 [Cucurbita moschata]